MKTITNSKSRKLVVSKETVRSLNEKQLSQVVAASAGGSCAEYDISIAGCSIVQC